MVWVFELKKQAREFKVRRDSSSRKKLISILILKNYWREENCFNSCRQNKSMMVPLLTCKAVCFNPDEYIFLELERNIQLTPCFRYEYMLFFNINTRKQEFYVGENKEIYW